MSNIAYFGMSNADKPLVWLSGEIKTPPFSKNARLKAGFYLRKLQQGELLEMPISRPMPSVGKQCHELRLNDKYKTWRIIYHIANDCIVILEVFAKKTQKTPIKVIDNCKHRLELYKK